MATEEKKHWLEPPEWWKKAKPLRWLAILGILFVAFSVLYTAKVVIAPAAHPETDKFTAGAKDPAAMIEPLNSYDSVARVRDVLDAKKLKYTVTPVRPKSSTKYPPRDTDTIVVAGYPHYGVAGQLTLEFFNDRLFEATFVPADLKEYVGKLHASDPRLKREKDGRTEVRVGTLRIATNVDFASTDTGRNLQTKPYVIWQEMRLKDALDEWDRRFVAIPGKPPAE